MKKPFLFVAVLTIILSVSAYLTGGTTLLTLGLSRGTATLIQALPLIIVSFIAIGQLQSLLCMESMQNWMEKYSGRKGIIFSALAGGIFPGGPYVFFPFLYTFKDKEIPFYLFFSFIIGKELYDFTRVPMEASIIGPLFSLIRFLIVLPIPIIMGSIIYVLMPKETVRSFFKEETASVSAYNSI